MSRKHHKGQPRVRGYGHKPAHDLVSELYDDRKSRRHPIGIVKPGQVKFRNRPARVEHQGRVTHNGKPAFRAAPRLPLKIQRVLALIKEQERLAGESGVERAA